MRKCQSERTFVELIAVAEQSDRTKFWQQLLNPLMDGGLIEMTISNKPCNSRQKYRLTAKVRQVMTIVVP